MIRIGPQFVHSGGVAAAALVASLACAAGAPAKPPFLEAWQQRYVLPRAFPDSSIGDSLRIRTAAFLTSLRTTLTVADTLATTVDCAWRSIGPTNVNGRVTGIAFDPDDDRRLFVSTVGGVWRSEDASRTWRRVTNNRAWGTLPPARWSCVAVTGGDSTSVYAGSGDANYAVSPYPTAADTSAGVGIWRSFANGDGVWTKVTPSELDGETIFRLRIDPSAPHDVYAATSLGVWRGHDPGSGGAMTWSRVKGVSGDKTRDFKDGCSDLVVDFAAAGGPVLFAGVYRGSNGKGIWKHSNGTWSKRMGGIPSTYPTGAIALAMAPGAPATLYARIVRSDAGVVHGVYKASNARDATGPSWSTISTPVFDTGDPGDYAWYNNAIEVSPRDANEVVVGGRWCFRRVDTGAGTATFQNISNGADTRFAAIHEDVHALAFDPREPGCVFVGDDGGLDRSTDLALSPWHWEHVSHGMTTTELYAVGTQDAAAPATAVGAQDNGSAVTFGNRTWYAPEPGDMKDDVTGAAIDATDALTIYTTSGAGRLELTHNPVIGSAGAPGTPVVPAPPPGGLLEAPFAAHPVTHLEGVTAGTYASGAMGVFTLDPGLTPIGSQAVSNALGSELRVASLAVSAAGHVLAGLATPDRVELGAKTASGWHHTATAVPQDKMPNAVAFDPNDDTRAYAAFGGRIGGALLVSTDGGVTWTEAASDPSGAVPLTALAVSPFETNVVYAGTVAGVLRGAITASPWKVTWSDFSTGLPVPLDVTGLAVQRSTGVLVASSMGFGAFERTIMAGTPQCTSPMLLVRDNVFDRGDGPAPTGIADPEHPVPGADWLSHPDDSAAGSLYWWSSPDIRIEDTMRDAGGNQVPPPGIAARVGGDVRADAVEVQTCPIDHADCPAGSLIDYPPVHGRRMRVHVVVQNRGFKAIHDVRVVALWADASVGLGPLPADFWTAFFKDGETSCGTFDDTGDWHLVTPSQPCTTLDTIEPDQPTTASFEWVVPWNAGDHCCMIALVDSPDDPVEAWARSELQTHVLVPGSRHFAQRNLHVIDLWRQFRPGWLAEFWLRNPWLRRARFRLELSRIGLPAGIDVRMLLPPGSIWDSKGLAKLALPARTGGKRTARRVVAREATLSGIELGARDSVRIGLEFVRREPGRRLPPRSGRFSVIARADSSVVGGSTWILRTVGPGRRAKPSRAR